ncbi:DMT family transporter [Candidatus Woesearchaeota archaeon]|nr:DMT family transporter [Candidatus Woesearchaeota archaeon]
MELLPLFFGLIAMLGYGLSNAMAQVPSKELGADRTLFYRGVVILCSFFLLLPFFSWTWSLSWIALALGIGVIGYIPTFFYYRALAFSPVGLVAPIGGSFVIFTTLFASLFFGEVIKPLQWAAVGVILGGIFLLTMDPRKLSVQDLFSKGVLYAAIACFFWGVVFTLWKFPVAALGFFMTSVFVELTTCSIGGLLSRKNGRWLPPRHLWLPLFGIGVLGGMGTLAYNAGISSGSLSIVAAITATSPLASMLYGRFVLHENMSGLQYLGILIAVSGMVLLAL